MPEVRLQVTVFRLACTASWPPLALLDEASCHAMSCPTERPTWQGIEGDPQCNGLQGTEGLEADPAQVEP